MSYTDTVLAGDRLVAKRKDDVKTFTVAWITHNDGWARSLEPMGYHGPGKVFKISRRGNDGRLFVGQYKVVGRI